MKITKTQIKLAIINSGLIDEDGYVEEYKYSDELDVAVNNIYKLLATISKEEQSQRIMMEQVEPLVIKNGIASGGNYKSKQDKDYYGEVMSQVEKDKQNKPVCEHKWKNSGWGNEYFCTKCKMFKSPPIEDTNKTSLEVPKFEKIKQLKGTDVGIDVILDFEESAINQLIRNQKKLIDYLTLISLDKK